MQGKYNSNFWTHLLWAGYYYWSLVWVYPSTLEIERAEAAFLDLCANFRSFVGSLL